MASPVSLAIGIAEERAWLQRVAGRSMFVRSRRAADRHSGARIWRKRALGARRRLLAGSPASRRDHRPTSGEKEVRSGRRCCRCFRSAAGILGPARLGCRRSRSGDHEPTARVGSSSCGRGKQRGGALMPAEDPCDRDQAIAVLRETIELGVTHIDISVRRRLGRRQSRQRRAVRARRGWVARRTCAGIRG
jgi:hypothetical protein